MRTYTVLRYPGGKTQLLPFVSGMLNSARSFAEPYAGGAGIGLGLLLNGQIDELFLNDFSYPIFCLWGAVVHHFDELISLIDATPITVEEWRKQKEIYENEAAGVLGLGFATLFLNRTNFSGILNGKPLGGFDQSGENKIDCRFNKKEIIARVKAIARYKDRISLSCLDGAGFIRSLPGNTFLFVDPPYFVQGKSLYGSEFTEEKFEALAESLASVDNPFLLTLDDVPVLRDIFGKRFATGTKELRYSVNNKRKQREFFVAREKSSVGFFDCEQLSLF